MYRSCTGICFTITMLQYYICLGVVVTVILVLGLGFGHKCINMQAARRTSFSFQRLFQWGRFVVCHELVRTAPPHVHHAARACRARWSFLPTWWVRPLCCQLTLLLWDTWRKPWGWEWRVMLLRPQVELCLSPLCVASVFQQLRRRPSG